jgi:translation initiation factor 2 gamma subunit (eIF-2gamma)
MKKRIPKRILENLTKCPACGAPITVKHLSDCDEEIKAYLMIKLGYSDEWVVDCEGCGNISIVKDKEA